MDRNHLPDGVTRYAATLHDLETYELAHRQLAHMAAPRLVSSDHPDRRLFFAYFDGTNNDATRPGEIKTNVALLHDAQGMPPRTAASRVDAGRNPAIPPPPLTRTVTMSPRASRTATTLATPLLLVALQGCSTPMNSDAATPARYPPPGHFENVNRHAGDGPLRFWQHNFGAYCFDTWGCRVTYGTDVIADEPESKHQPALESLPGDVRGRMSGTFLGFKNFQGPVVIDWQDKARRPLRHVIDLDALFADGLIRHNVPPSRIRPNASISNPDIIVEVNNRTVRVYMRARIPLMQPAIAGNPYSNAVDENVLVTESVL